MRIALKGVLLAVGLIALSGCKPDAAVKQGQAVGKGIKPAVNPPYIAPSATAGVPDGATSLPAANGSITGTVSLNGTPPAKITIDTSMDPACGIGSSAPVFTEQYVGSKGKLANVFVYVKNGPPAALQAGPVTTQTVVLDQKGCQYVPHVIALMAGGTVQFQNSDPTMHNIHTMPTVVGNETVDVSQGPRGAAVTKQLQKAEVMMPVRCNNHPWMNAFINVSSTPFFAVTDTNGHFSLTGLPPGEYTIAAVHEKLGEKDLQISVPSNGAAKADFTFAMK